MILINYSLFLITAAVLIYISYSDIRYRKIPNDFIIVLFFLSVTQSLFVYKDLQILIPVLVLIIGFVLSSMNLIGAGDVKLATVLLFSLPESSNQLFLILVAMCGLPLAICLLIFNFVTKKNIKTVPYGVAIAAGYLGTLTLL